jgi:hypothetical protein
LGFFPPSYKFLFLTEFVPFYLTPIIASATMLTHYSRLYPVNTAKLAKVTALSNPVTTIPTKALVLSDFSCTVGLVFVDTFGIIQFLANPVISNVTATSYEVSGNLGDATNHYYPCYIDDATAVIPVLAPRNLAEKLNLRIGSVCPTTLDAPNSTLPPPDLAKLGFADVTNGTGDAPIITLIDTVLPWPMGIPPPTGNFLTKSANYPTEALVYCPGFVWFGAMKILWESNAGHPLHVQGPLFDATQVIAPQDFVGVVLSDTLHTPVLALPIGEERHAALMQKCDDCCALAAALARNCAPPTPNAPSASAPTTPPTAPPINLTEFTTALTDTFRAFATQTANRPVNDASPMSLTDQGKVAALKVSTARQQLLVGIVRTKMSADGSLSLVTELPPLSPGILGPMADTSQLDRCTHLFENWRHSANRLSNKKDAPWIASYIDIMRLTSCYDSFWAKCLLMGTWSPHANPVQFPSTFTQLVSVFNFLVPYPESKSYIARSAAGHLEHAELMAEEHQSKRQRSNTKLSLDGKQQTHAHLMAMLANLYSWFVFIVNDPAENPDQTPFPPDPVIIQIILAWANLFKTPEAKGWFEFFHPQTFLVHSIILDINSSLSPIFQLVGEQEYRLAAMDGIPIPATVYTQCLDNANHQVSLYVAQIRTFRLTITGPPPSYGGICCPLQPEEIIKGAITKKPAFKEKTRSPNPAGSPTPRNPDTPNSSPGFLIWTRDPVAQLGPPKNSTIWHNINGRTGRLCTNFMIRGMTCKQTECRYLHLSKFSDLSTDNKRLFTQWVNDNSTLAFAPTPRTPAPPAQPPTPSGNTPPVVAPPP